MKTNLTTTNNRALAPFAHSLFSSVLLPALFLLLAIQPGQAGSATWKSNPVDDNWNTATNWTPQTVPNGPSDTATFVNSNITDITVSGGIELNGMAFNGGASSFGFTVSASLALSGTGITNSSGDTQNLLNSGGGSSITFKNSAAAADMVLINNPNSLTHFQDSSSAAGATITNTVDGSSDQGGQTLFLASSSAGSATISNEGAFPTSLQPAVTFFFATSTADNAIISADGSFFSGAAGGAIVFVETSNAANATLIANGGSNGGEGGQIIFVNDAAGGAAGVQVFDNGALDISGHNAPGLTIGALEGSGNAFLGGHNLETGSNNISTSFSGLLQDGGYYGGSNGSLTKIGRGKMVMSNANTYTGGTTVSRGTLLVTNRTGSATGTGAVAVNAGIFGGTGKVSGAVTIGTATKAATLAPGSGKAPGKLTTNSALTFNAKGVYRVSLNSNRGTASQMVSKGVTINSGATAVVTDSGTTVLTSGTVFTIINNTANTAIAGTFSNLADGTTLVVGSNTYRASYTGGTGNDLTLTVE